MEVDLWQKPSLEPGPSSSLLPTIDESSVLRHQDPKERYFDIFKPFFYFLNGQRRCAFFAVVTHERFKNIVIYYTADKSRNKYIYLAWYFFV